MTGRRTMMVLATALLAGSLLATGAQARGGGGGGGGGRGRRGTRGRWRLQRRFHGWLWRRSCRFHGWLWGRSCWWLWRKSHGWLRRRSHGGHGPRSLWPWKTWFRRLLRLRQPSVLHVIRPPLPPHLPRGDS